ncbi:unnamed protein product [Hermetia illucens]|uniref:Cytochrome c oxidase assembly factor 3 n=1 Tax=Hermetia illucens TaxID=343691 RepID=A0A7R8UGK9_HERIL|nr:cytochrome c oxidase assembly factor 3, mitochondrial [Hermetia illucens]CAD7080495.1 unnamed protein product [Hermetia illucens]
MSSASSPSGGSNEPNVKFLDRKLDKAQVEFMRLVEQQNLERVQRLKKIRRNNILVGCGLGASVIGIYLYSMFSVAQEKFLDDFEEPKKVTQQQQ